MPRLYHSENNPYNNRNVMTEAQRQDLLLKLRTQKARAEDLEKKIETFPEISKNLESFLTKETEITFASFGMAIDENCNDVYSFLENSPTVLSFVAGLLSYKLFNLQLYRNGRYKTNIIARKFLDKIFYLIKKHQEELIIDDY